MSAAPFVVSGFVLGDFVPGYYTQLQYGAGAIALGLIAVKQLNVGNKTSGGSMVVDVDVLPIFSGDDSDSKVGLNSELSVMNTASLATPGVNLYNAAVTEATGASAHATIVISGAWTTAGSVSFRHGGVTYTASFAVTDTTPTLAGDVVAAAFNNDPHCPSTAVDTTGSVVVTVDQVGVRGNEYFMAVDSTLKPTGMVVTTTGGTVVHGTSTSAISLTPFTAGSGADSLSAILLILANDVYDFIALAQHDSTNVGKMKTFINSEAGSQIGHLEQVIMAFNVARATNISFAQATLNDPNFSLVSMLNGETYPAAIAASASAARSVINPQLPNYNWDGFALPGVLAHQFPTDIPGHSTVRASLSGGCTEITTKNGQAVITSAVQSHCMNGASADYRILYWGEDYVPKVIAKTIAAKWAELCMPGPNGEEAANPYVGDDLPPDQRETGDVNAGGTMRPARWYGEVVAILHDGEAANLLQDVDARGLPVIVYDSTQKAIMAAVPTIVKTQNHRGALLVRQTAA